MTDRPERLAADHFNGVSARARRVQLHIESGRLHIDADGGSGADDRPPSLQFPLADVRWPERSRHGPRVAHLRGGGELQALDAKVWDAWLRAAGVTDSPVVQVQQSWRGVLAAVLMLAVLLAAGYRWGVPALTGVALAALPASADRAIGDAALRSLDGPLLQPSQQGARHRQIRTAFERAVTAAGWAEPFDLRFHASPRLGPNAFALPGGTVVVTDAMLELLKGRDDVLIGVLAHELGHVRRRHGMRMLVQATLLATVASTVWGDFSAVLAAAPVLLGQSAYSRDFEREADGDAIGVLRAAGISPAVMIELFDRLAARRAADAAAAGGGPAGFDLGIALASHPADAERIQRFRDAAGR